MLLPERNKAMRTPPIVNLRCSRCGKQFPGRPRKTLAFTRGSTIDAKCGDCRELVNRVAAEIRKSVR